MELLFVKIHLGESRLSTVFELKGKRRKVDLKWHRKEASDVPPHNWRQSCEREIYEPRVPAGNLLQQALHRN